MELCASVKWNVLSIQLYSLNVYYVPALVGAGNEGVLCVPILKDLDKNTSSEKKVQKVNAVFFRLCGEELGFLLT